MEEREKDMRKGKVRPFVIILAALLVTAATIRFFFLPYWVANHIDHQLNSIPGYQVTYNDFSISVLRASVTLEGVTVVRSGNPGNIPFLETTSMRAGLDWNALPRGFWVARIMVDHPRLNFVKSDDTNHGPQHFPDNWTDLAKALIVLPVNSIIVRSGEIVYHDHHSVPKVVLRMTDVSLTAKNLQNTNGDERILSGLVEGSARVKNAEIKVDVQLNAFFNEPMFQLNAELSDLNLVDVRDFLRAYGQFDVQQGLFSLFTQAGTRNNKVVGFVKPLIRDVTIASLRDEDGPSSYLTRPSMRPETEDVWLVTNLVNNVEEIQFEGSLAKGKTNLWDAVGSTLHNAFVEALVAMLEKSARTKTPGSPLNSVKPEQKSSKVSSGSEKKKGFLRKIFKRNENRKNKSRRK